MRRRGFAHVEEALPGDEVAIGSLRVTATPAGHSGFRPPIGPTSVPLGFLVAGSRCVYFAGDTDIFSEMADLAGQIDVALLPIWGWGPTLGPGHLDPRRAAEALTLLQPSVVIPIHWGTLAARGVRKPDPSFLVDPPVQFAEYARQLAPQVKVITLQPGDRTTI
jgi:L-ascorbate metabolism protein UlaG (beta-lactamase superfamily)